MARYEFQTLPGSAKKSTNVSKSETPLFGTKQFLINENRIERKHIH